MRPEDAYVDALGGDRLVEDGEPERPEDDPRIADLYYVNPKREPTFREAAYNKGVADAARRLAAPEDRAEGLDGLAMKAEEYLEAVTSYLDRANQFTDSRRRHVERTGEELAELVAARLTPDRTPTEEPGWRKAHEDAGGDGHTGEFEYGDPDRTPTEEERS